MWMGTVHNIIVKEGAFGDSVKLEGQEHVKAKEMR